ncbi:hypothetical protein [Moraxella cuniculi]|nr:hypothetical protein [Moraxella cuniculi]
MNKKLKRAKKLHRRRMNKAVQQKLNPLANTGEKPWQNQPN